MVHGLFGSWYQRGLVLAGNVTDEKAHFQLYEVSYNSKQIQGRRTPGKLVVEKSIQLSDLNTEGITSESLYEAVHTFLTLLPVRKSLVSLRISVACIAVPAPTSYNEQPFFDKREVNRGSNELGARLGIDHVVLITDLLASGYGVLTLGRQDTVTLQDAPVVLGAPMACIGADVGLGECYLTWHSRQYTAWPSEGGHCEFAPKTELQLDLLRYLKSKFEETNRVSVERVVSKPGIVNVLEFLCDKYPDMINKDSLYQIAGAQDKATAIATLASSDRLCYKAMEIFVWTFGSEVGCAALKWLPYGGLYITGGIASHNVQRLRSDSTFMDAYYDKGRVNPLMRQVPVKVVVATDLCLRGVMVVAHRILKERTTKQNESKILVPRVAVYSTLAIALVAYMMRYKCCGRYIF
eukprot:CFRG5384T1